MKVANIISIAVLPTLLAGLLSCDRDEEFTTRVSGKVVNRYTQEPIEGAYVYLKDGVASSSPFDVGSNASDQRSETYTDANGEFSVELTGEYQPALGVAKEGYEFDPDWTDRVGEGIKLYGFEGGNYENQVLEMQAYAGFNPIFRSTVPVKATDTLTMYLLTKDLTIDFSWSDYICVGEEVCDTGSTPYPAVGEQYFRYQLDYIRGGKKNTVIDSVFLKSLEIYTDTIYY